MAKRPTTPRIKTVEIAVVQLEHARGLPLPAHQSEDAAGLDLPAAIAPRKTLRIAPGERLLVPTGLRLALPRGYEGQIRPRSGLALRHGITVLNSPGTIDSDYRGEVSVVLINLGDKPFELRRGERIAQLVIAPVVRARLVAVAGLDETVRGDGGYGSTGVEVPAAVVTAGELPAAMPPSPRRRSGAKKGTIVTPRRRAPESRPPRKR